MHIFIFFNLDDGLLLKVLKSLLLFLLKCLTLLRPLKYKLHNPLGAEVCSFTLYLFKFQTEHLQLWKEHVFPFSDVQKGGEGKTFDELLKDYSNDKRLVMTQLSVQTQENWGQLNQGISIAKKKIFFQIHCKKGIIKFQKIQNGSVTNFAPFINSFEIGNCFENMIYSDLYF